MAVAILGGAGEAAWRLAKLLLGNDKIREITLVDMNDKKLHKVANELSDSRIQIKCFDATDINELNHVLSDVSLVVNLVGPYQNHDQSILDAAIKSGCDYLDACDESEPMLKSLNRIDDAKSRNVTCVVGMATTPGLSNLLFRLAAPELDDDCDKQVVVSWGYGYDRETRNRPQHKKTHFNVIIKMAGILSKVGFARATGHKPTAFAQHVCNATTTPILQNESGDAVEPLQKIVNLFFPHKPELWNGFTTGHPEHIMLARSNGINKCHNTTLMSDFEWKGACNLKADTRSGKIDRMSTSLFFEMDSAPLDTESWLPCTPGGLVTLVKGTKDGQPALAAAALKLSRYPLLRITDGESAQDLSKLKNPKESGLNFKDTAISCAGPLAVAVGQMMAKKGEGGVFTPEEYFHVEDFFTKYANLHSMEEVKLGDVVEVDVEIGTDRVVNLSMDVNA